MKELELYQDDYENIVQTVLEAYNGEPISSRVNYCKKLYKSLTSIRNDFSFDEADLRQQLTLIWIYLVEKYYASTPKIHIRQYLIKCSSWMIRDWFRHEMLIQSHASPVEEKEETPFTIDVGFLINGTDYFPLNTLTPYERYLLFLYYREDKSIRQIAYIVQHDRLTVKNQMQILNEKLLKLQQEGFYQWQKTKQNLY